MHEKIYHNKDAYNDLDIDISIMKTIDKTITKIGKEKLRNKLKYCYTDYSSLKPLINRNNAIYNNLSYRNDMETKMHKIKELEDNLKKWIHDPCDNELLYVPRILCWFSENSFVITSINKLRVVLVLLYISVYVLLYLYIYIYHKRLSPLNMIVYGVSAHYNSILDDYIKNGHNIVISKFSAYIALMSSYVPLIYAFYTSLKHSYEHYHRCIKFIKSYNDICDFIDVVESMCDIEIYYDTCNVIKSIAKIKMLFNKNMSLGKSILVKLHKSKYTKHFNIISNYIGRVDCSLCITKLVDTYGYSIPTIVDTEYPVLQAEGVWHPLINSNTRVKNSIFMNNQTPNVHIITGLNKAGKSSYMKTVATAVYLGQSIGICCADNITFSPYKYICTYTNIPDSINKESLFEAELNRFYSYIKKTEEQNGFTIGFIDELLTGTNPRDGEAASYALLTNLSQKPLTISIVCTHYHNVVKQLSQSDFIFSNFTADINNGKYTYTYKKNDGISDQSNAITLLQETGYNSTIVADAYKYLDKIKETKAITLLQETGYNSTIVDDASKYIDKIKETNVNVNTEV